jgi:hypothetical protein
LNKIRLFSFSILFLTSLYLSSCAIQEESIGPISTSEIDAHVSYTSIPAYSIEEERIQETSIEEDAIPLPPVIMVEIETIISTTPSPVEASSRAASPDWPGDEKKPLPDVIPLPVVQTPTPPTPPVIPAETAAPGLASPEPGKPQKGIIFLTALNDGGRSGTAIGCGDSVVPVEVPFISISNPLQAAVEALLSYQEPETDELHNALDTSHLKLDHLSVEDREALIFLSGNLLIQGFCHSPRIDAQLKYTALQFPEVERVSIYFDGYPIFCQFIEDHDEECEQRRNIPGHDQTVNV